MNANNSHPAPRRGRALVFGLLAMVVILGAVLVVLTIQRSAQLTQPAKVDALAFSTDSCVTCHRQATPGIVHQYSYSQMATSKVSCRDCHEVKANYPGSSEHQSTYILPEPTTAMCQKCHTAETAQFHASRHALPAYVAYAGSKDLSPALMAQYQAIPEGQFAPDKARNAIFAIEGPDITGFACETCHDLGKPAADGSVGDCSKCHIRHEFSLEQVRKPETCNACHIGPDHPQWEIYQESPHGIVYATGGLNWNWNAAPGTLRVEDFPAPTCATCHFSSFGASGTTHKVGERLSWYLFASVSVQRPVWQDNRIRMQNVCLECHNKNFVDDFYTRADKATGAVNDLVKQSDEIVAPLIQQGIMTPLAFDQPIDFTYFELWHNWGRTAKFGTWMQGPDYTQWHGAYEVEKALVELKDLANQMLKAAGK